MRAHQSNKTCTPIEENENGIRIYKGKDPLVKSLLCQYCGKNFTWPHLLERHLTIHKEKPHCCKDCGKCFALESDLKSHEICHSKLMPFQCKTCPRGYTLKSALKRHEMIHTDERPYQCLTCQKRFRTKEKLQVHFWYHTGDTPFKCNICSKKFYRKNRLTKHKRIHESNVQPSQGQILRNHDPVNHKAESNDHSDPLPKMSFAELIAEALFYAKEGKLKLSEIYQDIAQRHPYSKVDDEVWKNSIRCT